MPTPDERPLELLADAEVEARLRDLFDRNLAELQAEGGHPLAPEVRESAWQQVRHYWLRLRELAERVTDTEVKLELPLQRSPGGRTFSIEGVVDIVREEGKTTMYDVKTHPREVVEGDAERYSAQLNVYAHIWHELRGEPLDATAVICTALPEAVDRAHRSGDKARAAAALGEWDPVVPMPFNGNRVKETIADFAVTVDRIEERRFEPPSLDKLRQALPGMTRPFATAVCRNCDARFSCNPYRRYVLGAGRTERAAYAKYISDLGDETTREAFVDAALEVPTEPLAGDIS